MKGEIDLTAGQRQIVLELIERHLPGTDVWAYGSRVQWTSRPESDLDLVVFSGADQSDQVSDLREAFEESDLPFRVDVLVWDELPESFQEAIDDEHVDLLVPHDYPSVPIGDIAEIVGGGTPSTKDPANFGGTVPWLTPRDLSRPHHPYVSRGARNLSRQGLTVSSASLVPQGAVLLSTRAPIGYTAIAACPLATNQGCRSLVPGNRILSAYLYYWLTANVPELQRHATGSTFAELSGRALKQIRIPLPSVSVQRRLTQVLEALDDKIELNRRMITTLDSLLRTIFCQWFVSYDPVRAKMEERDTGLPTNFADAFADSMTTSTLGPIPSGWTVKALGDILTLAYGRALSSQNRCHGNVPVYGSNGQIGWHDTAIVDGPGIVVGRKGTPGMVTWVPTSFYPIDTTFYVVPQGDCLSLFFLYFALQDQRLSLLAADSAVPGLNRTFAYTQQQVVPTRRVLDLFNECVEPYFDAIGHLSAELQLVTLVRRLLLPRLMDLADDDTGWWERAVRGG